MISLIFRVQKKGEEKEMEGSKLTDTKNRLVVARGSWGGSE